MILSLIYVFFITTTFFHKNKLSLIAINAVDPNSTLSTFKKVSHPNLVNVFKAVKNGTIEKMENQGLELFQYTLPISSEDEESNNTNSSTNSRISGDSFGQLKATKFLGWPNEMDCTTIYHIMSSPYFALVEEPMDKRNISMPLRCLNRMLRKDTASSFTSANMEKTPTCQQTNTTYINRNLVNPTLSDPKNKSIRRVLGASNVHISINLNVKSSNQPPCHSRIPSHNGNKALNECHNLLQPTNNDYFPRSKCPSGNTCEEKQTPCHDDSYSLSYPETSNVNINISLHISDFQPQCNKLRKKGSACSLQNPEFDFCNQEKEYKLSRSTGDKPPSPFLIDNQKPKLDWTPQNYTVTRTNTNAFVSESTKVIDTSSNNATERDSSEKLNEKNRITAVSLQSSTHPYRTDFSEEKMASATNVSNKTQKHCLSSSHNETLQTQNQATNKTIENCEGSSIFTQLLNKNNSNLLRDNTRVLKNSNEDMSIHNNKFTFEQENSSSWNTTLFEEPEVPCYQQHGVLVCDKNMKDLSKQDEFSSNTDNINGSQNMSLKCCSTSDAHCFGYEVCRHEDMIKNNLNRTSIAHGATQRFNQNNTSYSGRSKENVTKDFFLHETEFNNSFSNVSVVQTNVSNETQNSFNHNIKTMQTDSESFNMSSSQSLDELSRKTIHHQGVTADVSEKKIQSSTTQVKDSFYQESLQHTTAEEKTEETFLHSEAWNGIKEYKKNASVSFSKENENNTWTTKFTNIATDTSEKRDESMSFINTSSQAESQKIFANTNSISNTEASRSINQEVARVNNESLYEDFNNLLFKYNASDISSTRELKPSTKSSTGFLLTTQDNKKDEVTSKHDLKSTEKLIDEAKNEENSSKFITNVTVIEQSGRVDSSKTEFSDNSNNIKKGNQTRFQTNDVNLNKYLSNCIEKMSMEECIDKLYLHCGKESSELTFKKTTSVKLEEAEQMKKAEKVKKTEIQRDNIKIEYYTTQPIERKESYLSRGVSSKVENNQASAINNRAVAQRFSESFNTNMSLNQKKYSISSTYPIFEYDNSVPPQVDVPETLFTYAVWRKSNSTIHFVKSDTVNEDSSSEKHVNTNETTSNSQLLHSCIFSNNTSLIGLPYQSPCESDTFDFLSTDSVNTQDNTTFSMLKKNVTVTDTSNERNQSGLSRADVREVEGKKNTVSCVREENGLQTKSNSAVCNVQVESNSTEMYKHEADRNEGVFGNSSSNEIQVFFKQEKVSSRNDHSSIIGSHNCSFIRNTTSETYFQSTNVEKESEYEKNESNISQTFLDFCGIGETKTNRCKNALEKQLTTLSEGSLTNIQNNHQVSIDSSNKSQIDMFGSHKAHGESISESSFFDSSSCNSNSTNAECLEFNKLDLHEKNVPQRNGVSFNSLDESGKKQDSYSINTNTNCSCDCKPMKYYSYDGEQCDFEEEDTIVEFDEDTKDALVRFSKEELQQSSIELESLDDTITDDIVFIPCVTIRSRKTTDVISHVSGSPINGSTLKNSSSLINALRTLTLPSIGNSTFNSHDNALSTSSNPVKSSIPQHVAEKLSKLKEIMNSQILQVEVKKQNNNISSHIDDDLLQNSKTKRQHQTVRIMARNDVMLSQSRIADSKKKTQAIDKIYNETIQEEHIGQIHENFLAETNTSLKETLVTTEESHKTSETFSVIEKKPVRLILAGIAITGGFMLFFFLVNLSMERTVDIEDRKFLTSCIPLNEDDKSLPFSGCRETFVDVENTSFL